MGYFLVFQQVSEEIVVSDSPVGSRTFQEPLDVIGKVA